MFSVCTETNVDCAQEFFSARAQIDLWSDLLKSYNGAVCLFQRKNAVGRGEGNASYCQHCWWSYLRAGKWLYLQKKKMLFHVSARL